MSPVLQRIVAAFGAHSFGQAINIFIQLASLPLFISRWDTATYGVWLMLTAMPSYLTMSDGGLVTAAANQLAMALARDDKEEANQIFQSAFAFILITCTTVWCVAWLIIFLVQIPGVITTDRKIALLCLCSGVLIAQFNGLAESIFRAANRNAQGIMLGNISRLLEWSGWVIGLFLFKTFNGVAATGLLFRSIGFILIFILSIKIKSGVNWGFQHSSTKEIRILAKPAISFMAFPLANALGIQGITLLVGHLLGPIAVTIFNTYRTISRVALQVTGTLGNSLWAEFSSLYAKGGARAVGPVYRRANKVGAMGSAGMSLILFFASPYLLAVWSRKNIGYDATLMSLMLIYAAVGGSWGVARTLLMSINSHSNLSKMAIGAAISSLIICYPLGSYFHLSGIAAGILIIESIMAFLCITAARTTLKEPQNGQ